MQQSKLPLPVGGLLALSTFMVLVMTSHFSRVSTAISTTGTRTRVLGEKHTAPDVQVFLVTTTPAHGSNWDDSAKTATDGTGGFRSFASSTPTPLQRMVVFYEIRYELKLMKGEKSARHSSNLLFAAFQKIYELNPHSDWPMEHSTRFLWGRACRMKQPGLK